MIKKEIKFSSFGKKAIEKAIEYLISQDISDYNYMYKDILKKITFADELVLVYNIKED